MMASDPAVKTGIWTNYEPGGGSYLLWTVSDIRGTIFKVFLGVIFGLAWPWARAILQRSWLWFTWSRPWSRPWSWSKRKWTEYWYGSVSDGEIDPLFSGTSSSTQRRDDQQDDQPKQKRFARFAQWMPLGKSDLFLTVAFGLAAIFYAVAGGAVGEIPADSLGRTNTPKSACGQWDLKRDVDRRVEDFDTLVMAQKEARAAEYGRDCHGSHSVYTPGRCDFFVTSQIEYTVEAIDCPFKCTKDRCICANGSFKTARRFSTGLFSAEKLGLNGQNLPFIRRTSTFVPLDINFGFVEEPREGRYEYYLGPVDGRSYTFDSFGDPFEWDIAAYSVSVHESPPTPRYGDWQPIKALERNINNSYMTAMFISPCRIAYNGRCEDPIFLATDDLSYIGLPNNFRRNDTRARVLIAIDEIEICRQKDMDCWPPSEEKKEFGIEYEFVRTALRRTSTIRSIENRLGKALVATERLGDFHSPQLDKDQWIIESQGLFNTSLARLQFNMLDMATGNHPTGAAADGFESAYENSTPDWAKDEIGHMCDNYKFHMSGPYTNIRVSYALPLLLVPLVLCVLSTNTKTELPDGISSSQTVRYYMVFDSVPRWVKQGPALVQQFSGYLTSLIYRFWVFLKSLVYNENSEPQLPRSQESVSEGSASQDTAGQESESRRAGPEASGSEESLPQESEPQGAEQRGTESNDNVWARD